MEITTIIGNMNRRNNAERIISKTRLNNFCESFNILGFNFITGKPGMVSILPSPVTRSYKSDLIH